MNATEQEALALIHSAAITIIRRAQDLEAVAESQDMLNGAFYIVSQSRDIIAALNSLGVK